jgi:hypothetical protein
MQQTTTEERLRKEKDKTARKLHNIAFDAARERGFCFECSTELGFRATGKQGTALSRGVLCSKSSCPTRRNHQAIQGV